MAADLEWSVELDKIAPALVSALGEMPTIPKTEEAKIASTKGNYGYRYADLAGYLDAVRPVLARHSLAVLQPVTLADGLPVVTTIVLHSSGQWVRSSMAMRVEGGNAQAVGSAITYARRYALGAVLSIATDDDDGKAASTPRPQQQRQAGPQLGRMGALMAGLGISETPDRLALARLIVEKDIEKAGDLSASETLKVIDVLERVGNGELVITYEDHRPVAVVDTSTGEVES